MFTFTYFFDLTYDAVDAFRHLDHLDGHKAPSALAVLIFLYCCHTLS